MVSCVFFVSKTEFFVELSSLKRLKAYFRVALPVGITILAHITRVEVNLRLAIK